MGKTILAVLAVATVGAFGAIASGAPPQKGTLWNCSITGSVSVLWWPAGHGEIRSLGFPKWATPHIELFKGRRPGTDTVMLYAGVRGEGSIPPFATNPYCIPEREGVALATGAGLRSLNGAKRLTCRVKASNRTLVARFRPGSYRVQVVQGRALLVDAKVNAARPAFRYAPRACSTSPAPK